MIALNNDGYNVARIVFDMTELISSKLLCFVRVVVVVFVFMTY